MDKRTLGCICDHGTTECKDIVSLCDAHRGYCGVYVCNKGLQEILRLSAQNDAMGCIDAFCHPEFISGSIQGGSLQFNTYKMLLEFLPRSQSFGKGTLSQEPQSVRYPALMPCRNSLKQVQHDDWVCSRIENVGQAMPDGFSGLPRKSDDFLAMTDNRNITKPMRNEQNGLVVMFSSAKHHKAQETKPETDRNQIQNKLWQKQSNRNISTCVAQREVA